MAERKESFQSPVEEAAERLASPAEVRSPAPPEASSVRSWHLQMDENHVAWLHFDYAGSRTNVLSKSALDELQEQLEEIEKLAPTGLVILSDKPNGFIAGADVREFTQLHNEEEAFEQIRRSQNVLDRLDSLPFPSVSLIHGFCLGGGTELALACRYRVAADDPGTRIGLPEVRLGIHPGFGGTVRLPRTIGASSAMDLMLTGRTISARAAKKLGLVHYAVPARHLHQAARALIETPPQATKRSLLRHFPDHRFRRQLIATYLRRKVSEKAPRRHYPAPYALIDLWQRHADQPQTMMVEEARSVARLLMGETAQNLIRVFFLHEQLKALGRQSDFRARQVHVVGAGTMGGDIAAWCAVCGLRVTLQDQSPRHIGSAIARANALFRRRLKEPRMVQAAMDRLIPDHKGFGVAKADVVIEAIFENADAKQALFRELEPRMKPDALLASNTSSIPLQQLAQGLQRPGRLVGLHFFNPVAKMQLVEVVASGGTDPGIVRQASAFTRQIDRLPLPVESSPGFLVNRILMPYLIEAVTLVGEGVPPTLIDQAALEFGMPVGPVELADTVGLDICLSVAEILSQQLGGEVPEILRNRIREGKLGRKSGSGFYSYRGGKPLKPKPSKGHHAPADMQDRLILRMLNESAACLREGIVQSADLLDAGLVFATGFAPFRGGPMHYVRTRFPEIKNRFEALEQRYGTRFRPDPGWDKIVSPAART